MCWRRSGSARPPLNRCAEEGQGGSGEGAPLSRWAAAWACGTACCMASARGRAAGAVRAGAVVRTGRGGAEAWRVLEQGRMHTAARPSPSAAACHTFPSFPPPPQGEADKIRTVKGAEGSAESKYLQASQRLVALCFADARNPGRWRPICSWHPLPMPRAPLPCCCRARAWRAS